MSTYGSTNTGILLNNAAENPATIVSGAYVTNTTTLLSGDAVVGTGGITWTVDNYGTVVGGAQQPSQLPPPGILLAYGGTVFNGHTGFVTGVDGVVVVGGIAAVSNDGTIESDAPGTATAGGVAVYIGAGGVVSNDGLISSPDTGVDVKNSSGTVDNLGTIVSTSTSQRAVLLSAGGLVVNGASGSNTALIQAAGSDGVAVTGSVAGTVNNFGTITTTAGHGVYLTAGGTVTNSGLISASNTSHAAVSFHNVAGTVGNSGTIASTGDHGVYFESGGSLANSVVGALITGGADGIDVLGAAGSIANAGTIAHIGSGTSGEAIYLGAGGVIQNAAGALISGSRPGNTTVGYAGAIEAHNLPATVINLGTITNLNGNGVNLLDGGLLINGPAGSAVPAALIYSPRLGIYMGGSGGTPIAGAVGTVVNYGTIANANSISATIQLVSGGVVGNFDLISSGRTGISIKNAIGTIDNSGTIVSTAATSFTAGAGAYLGAGGQLVNSTGGLITAQRAAVSLAFQGTTSAGATVVNDGTLVGSVGISIGTGDTGSNTLINAGTVIGTSGVAVQLGSGLSVLIEEPSATIRGAIANFQQGDTIDTAGLVANGFTYSGGVLTLEDNGTIVAQPTVSTPYASPVFTLTPDGAGGTDVTVLATATQSVVSPPLPAGAGVFWNDPASGDTGYWTFNASGGLSGFDDLADGNSAYTPIAAGQFDASGRSEVLWEDQATGDTGYWTTNSSGQLTGFNDFGAADTAYSIVGVGDFTGDGIDQVLWQDTATGDTGYWTTNASGQLTGFNDFGDGNSAYTIVGVGDFDGNGRDEVAWEDKANGDTGYWTANSSGQLTGFTDFGDADTAYTIVGVGDFDGSGHDELLWENQATGDTGYWTTSGGQLTGFHDFGLADTAYSVVGVGDFDGSGHDEVLWQDAATGDTGYWTTNAAGQVTGFHDLGDAATGYHVIPS